MNRGSLRCHHGHMRGEAYFRVEQTRCDSVDDLESCFSVSSFVVVVVVVVVYFCLECLLLEHVMHWMTPMCWL